ncbi:hypothetical protein RRF57_012661 [Xylaria bambusicola]|uniref:Uncharacterized protein n=1 Tax=Xylaria bambusicola TaxID=326684 RepID=A0AAN7V5V4_9PEZI
MAPCLIMGESLDFSRWVSRSVALTTVIADGIIMGSMSGNNENIDMMDWCLGVDGDEYEIDCLETRLFD